MPPLPLSTVWIDDIEGVGRLINWDAREGALLEPCGVAETGGVGVGVLNLSSKEKGALIDLGGVAEAGGEGVLNLFSMERTMSDTDDAASGVHGVCGGEGG